MANNKSFKAKYHIERNLDPKVVEDFGREWATFNQADLSDADLKMAFDQYFHLFPFDKIDQHSVGFDMGCGTGRWAKFIAPRVGQLTCVDPSSLALKQAQKNLKNFSNVKFECASVAESKIENNSQDFAYSLGVLHHIPDTLSGIKSCSQKLKRGAPFLVYLYYGFDNKPAWFKTIWKFSDILRRVICVLPYPIKLFITQIIAILVYWPLSRIALILERFGFNVENVPLADYRNKPLYFLRTDALDRFGTKLEKRFTKAEIEKMLLAAGFHDIQFSSRTPYWVALASKL